MVKRMLIDASHAEETRVVVANGTRLEEFDFETSTKKQLKGNFYLAKVMRVEPSLQAAFVEYGGNRHGFLPFGEIHPDYYQIPVADRDALFAEQQAAAADEDTEDTEKSEGIEASEAETSEETSGDGENSEGDENQSPEGGETMAASGSRGDSISEGDETGESDDAEAEKLNASDAPEVATSDAPEAAASDDAPEAAASGNADGAEESTTDSDANESSSDEEEAAVEAVPQEEAELQQESEAVVAPQSEPESEDDSESSDDVVSDEEVAAQSEESGDEEIAPNENRVAKSGESVETLGGDEIDDEAQRRLHVSRSLLSRRYKIQEVIKKRQIMLIQVVKEERGNKGAALTTYLSLAGRYCVLMPNAVRGGGISRKIVNVEDRKRLKTITKELKVPPRMAMIVRTAGLARTRSEIKRDFEYLLRQWEGIREATMGSSAPVLINEEANLIRRSIRDLYSRDIDQILVEGDGGYRIAKDFMRTLIPSHSAKVQPYRDRIPLFARYQIEGQLDAMYSPQVQLRSGGYLVINPTEALVSIDVNSGRATKQRTIEETALKTNQEAADEIARQLRLRDLAGLVVIDFIDMDENRNQRNIERRFKEAMRNDRARIQIGRISPFGLLELSRQRLRPSLLENATEVCVMCTGSGLVRATSSSAVHVLRAIEEEGLRERSAEISVSVPGQIALYILNKKRQALTEIESLYGMDVSFKEDASLIPPMYTIETLSARDGIPSETAFEMAQVASDDGPPVRATPSEADGEDQPRRRRRRRKPRTARGEEDGSNTDTQAVEATSDTANTASDASSESTATPGAASGEDGEDGARSKRRRRGRRGGRRRNSRNRETTEGTSAENSASQEATAPDSDATGMTPPADAEISNANASASANDGETPPDATPDAVPDSDSGDTAGERAAATDSEEAAPKPKRRARRSPRRKPKITEDVVASAVDSPAPDQSAAESPAPSSDPSPTSAAPEATVETASANSPAPATSDSGETPEAKSDAKDKTPAAPRRAGWWQRVLK
jgi:ribonuclease E